MYLRRILFLIVVAIGTVALAASIVHYNPRRRAAIEAAASPGAAYELVYPNGQKTSITAAQLERLIRNATAPDFLPGSDATSHHNYLLKKLFRGVTPLIQITTKQGDITLLVTGVAIPNSKDQRILTYVSDDSIYALVDDFVRPATETINRIRIEHGELIYSNGTKDLFSHELEFPTKK